MWGESIAYLLCRGARSFPLPVGTFLAPDLQADYVIASRDFSWNWASVASLTEVRDCFGIRRVNRGVVATFGQTVRVRTARFSLAGVMVTTTHIVFFVRSIQALVIDLEEVMDCILFRYWDWWGWVWRGRDPRCLPRMHHHCVGNRKDRSRAMFTETCCLLR